MSDRKLALVTGGSRGIGRAVCLCLAAQGMDIALTYTGGKEAAEATAEECRGLGVTAECFQADVRSSEACAELVKKVTASFGRIDVLVNNAGITKDTLIMRMSDSNFEDVLRVNAFGAFYMMREVSRVMLKARRGRIINISSVVGLTGNAGQVNYAASKAAVIGMTKSLARELASRKITVNAVAPGFIRTDMTMKMDEKTREAILTKIPLGEMGRPEDIAETVAFLAGDRSGYITGQVFCVDGGMAM